MAEFLSVALLLGVAITIAYFLIHFLIFAAPVLLGIGGILLAAFIVITLAVSILKGVFELPETLRAFRREVGREFATFPVWKKVLSVTTFGFLGLIAGIGIFAGVASELRDERAATINAAIEASRERVTRENLAAFDELQARNPFTRPSASTNSR